MRTILLIGTFLMGIHFASAQLITTSVGPSFAVGEYADKDYYNEKASQAGVGFNLKLSNEFYPESILSPTAFLFYNTNAITSGQIETVIPNSDFVALNPYKQLGVGVGFALKTTGKKIKVGISGNAALASYRSASFVLNDQNSDDYVKLMPSHASGLIFSGGAFVRIPFSKVAMFNLGVDYWAGKAEYLSMSYENRGMGYSKSLMGLKIPVTMVTVQVGLSINLRYNPEE